MLMRQEFVSKGILPLVSCFPNSLLIDVDCVASYDIASAIRKLKKQISMGWYQFGCRPRKVRFYNILRDCGPTSQLLLDE